MQFKTLRFKNRIMKKREKFMKKAKETVKEALQSRDMLLSGVTKTIDALDKMINLMGERLEEWYGIYFPELRMDDKIKYAELVLIIDRKDLDPKELSGMVGQKKAEEIVQSAGKTLGADITAQEMIQVQSLAKTIIELDSRRTQYEEHQKDLAHQLIPNMTKVAGADIAAKLVSHVGNLKRLCKLPASTIQVLGAEKALFKHLKNRRVKPPKHGIIFQHPKIAGSPKAIRGKVARALANKLSLAVKADAITKRDISNELLSGFEERYDEILVAYNEGKKK
jgi:nucleolar protein 56